MPPAGFAPATFDIVGLGWGEVPGSTYACGVLGVVVVGLAVYRDLGGQPLVTANPNWKAKRSSSRTNRSATGSADP